MNELRNTPLTGLLLRWEAGSPPDWRKLGVESHPGGQVAQAHRLVYSSSAPLVPEDLSRADEIGVFRYNFLYAFYSDHAILVSTSSDVVDAFVRRLDIERMFVRPSVDVARIVTDVYTGRHSYYALSRAFGWIEGQGDALRSISLYGEDVTNCNLFEKILDSLSPHYVQLHELSFGISVLSIGTRGQISFQNRGPESLELVLESLGFLSGKDTIQARIRKLNEARGGGEEGISFFPDPAYIEW